MTGAFGIASFFFAFYFIYLHYFLAFPIFPVSFFL